MRYVRKERRRWTRGREELVREEGEGEGGSNIDVL